MNNFCNICVRILGRNVSCFPLGIYRNVYLWIKKCVSNVFVLQESTLFEFILKDFSASLRWFASGLVIQLRFERRFGTMLVLSFYYPFELDWSLSNSLKVFEVWQNIRHVFIFTILEHPNTYLAYPLCKYWRSNACSNKQMLLADVQCKIWILNLQTDKLVAPKCSLHA